MPVAEPADGPVGDVGEEEPECPAPDDPDAPTTTSTTTTTLAVDEDDEDDEVDPCCLEDDPDSTTTTTTTTMVPGDDEDECPEDPTTTTTTVPGDPAATTTVPATTAPATTVPGDPGATTTTPTATVPTEPGATTTTVPGATTTTTVPAAPAPPTTPPASTPAAPAAPAPAAPAPPPTLPPAIPIPPPAAAPPPIGEPVKPAIADPVADPLADAATLASTRLHLWQDALATVVATQLEADTAQADAVVIADRIATATAELASLPEPSDESENSAPVAAGLVDVAALLTGESEADEMDPVVERRRVLTTEIAVAEAEQRTVAARLDELGARLIEDRIVARATELGHDSARGVLADMAAARIDVANGNELDKVWSTTDPRRLEVLYTALRQVGDPYVFATSGPERFDCSGLTLYAWQTVGVRLAHYSFTQRGQTPAADERLLEPGDLVFNLRSNGGHVMLYLGVENGIVHAPGTGKRVEVSRWRRATGFGSPLAPVDAATLDAGTIATKPVLDVPVAVAGAPAVRGATVATSAPTTTAAATDAANLDAAATTTTSTTPPPTWVGGVPEGARIVDAPDAGLYDGTGALYGVDPALLAGRARAVDEARAAAEAAAVAAAIVTPGVTGPTTVVPPGAVASDGPLGLRPDLAARLGVDPLHPVGAADGAARYLAAAAPLLGGTETALVALDLGAGVVASRGLPALGPARDLLDATLRAAQALRPPPPPPPNVPVTTFDVLALPPAPPTRMVVALRRRAA